jgi:hypothetical protein
MNLHPSFHAPRGLPRVESRGLPRAESRGLPRATSRGSLLIVAMILTAVIGISLASYIRLGLQSQKISNRALYNNAAINLAENGLEEAMYSINQMVDNPSYGWTGWSTTGTGANDDAKRRFPSSSGTYSFDQNATGYVRVYVYNYKGINSPVIVARSTINLGGGSSTSIEKWIEVTLTRTSKFANGLVAKDTILFRGNNPSVDSWNSDPGHGTSGHTCSYTAFSSANKNDAGSVGSISVAIDSVLVKQADVWGYVSTNGDDPTDAVGNNGSIKGEDTPSGVKVDPNRVSTSFSASFDAVSTPDTSSLTTLGDISSPTTLGTAGTATTILCDEISLSGNSKILTIVGDVTLVISAGPGENAINITGNSSGITVAANSSLKIYTAGDISLTGQGITNTSGAPKNVQIYGTSTSTSTDQAIKVAGGGSFSGCIYAPNGSVELRGDGSMWGSVVAEDIDLTGNANFHYDESLGNLDAGNPFRVGSWKELTLEDESGTTSDRAGYRTDLSF